MTAIAAQFAEGILPAPGIYRNNTSYYSGYKWVDGDHIRFSSEVPEKIGGWTKEIISGTIRGVARRKLSWQALDSLKYESIGTHLFLYIKFGGIYYNITPIIDTSTQNNRLTTTSGLATVTVNYTSHDLRVGDWVRIDPSVAYNGITFFGDYEVTSITDNNNFVITAANVASGSGTGGGSVTVKKYLPAGLADSGVAGYGWGVGPYGLEAYGTARTTGFKADARLWCLQNWGEDLLALPIGGALYFWDTSGGVTAPATEVSTAPERSNFMIVSSKLRQCILFGTEDIGGNFDPMLIRWSDVEDYTEFTPASTNSAGEYRLSVGSRIVGAVETKGGEILVLTDQAAYRMRPVSTNDVYEVEFVGGACGLLSPFAMVDVDGAVYWMSNSAIKIYTGQVRTVPLSLEDYIFDQRSDGKFNDEQKVKFYAATNSDFNEVWFHYATRDSIELNRYFIFNHVNGSAYDGTMQRTCWEDKSVIDRPTAFDRAGNYFTHEQTVNADGAPLQSYVTLGDVDISNGDYMSFVDTFMPDGDFVGTINLYLHAKKRPQSTEVSSKTYNFVTPTEYVSVRNRGRLLSCTLESNQYNGDFKLGKLKFAVRADGKR